MSPPFCSPATTLNLNPETFSFALHRLPRTTSSLPFNKRKSVKPVILCSANDGFSSRLASARLTSTVGLQNSPYMPTWSKEHGFTKEPNPRGAILDYLKILGIDTEELQDLVLPTNLDIMKERVEFLQKLELKIEDINEYPLMLACSVKRNMVPVLDYLEKLGVKKSALPQLLKSYPQVLHSSVVIDLQPVVKYLTGLGVSEANLPRVLENYPEVLGFKLEGTMATSVAYLVSIGVNTRSIGPMISRYPPLLAMRVGKFVKPFVDYLLGLGIQKQEIAGILQKKPYILGFSLEEKVKANVECLLDFGVSRGRIGSIITEFPDILGLNLRPKLESQRDFFDSYVLVGSQDFGLMLERMPQISVISHEPVLQRLGLFRLWGFSIGDLSKMVVKCPQLLALNRDDMELAFNFFKSEMKGSLQELVEFPAFFTYGLESRIKPRFLKVSSRGLHCSLSWFLNCSDEKFEDRLDADYMDIEELEPSFISAETPSRKEEEEEEETTFSEEDEDYSEQEDEPDDEFYKQALYARSAG
eukprot:TRINITY_DN954_c0_g1_i2.p1 TRINITY_DN954_c0_g1~~TRINITY_DN954_c0_g1_i2.p1  ORF type:complete len:529 (-),score=107.45 TRINITY_DN954_c0_g1_i2:305-1891(-)